MSTTTKASMEEASVLVEAIRALCEEKGGVNSLCAFVARSSFDVVVNDECAYTFDGPLHYSSKRKRRTTGRREAEICDRKRREDRRLRLR